MHSAHAFIVQILVPVNIAVLVQVNKFKSKMGCIQIVLRHLHAKLTSKFITSHIHELINGYFVVFKKAGVLLYTALQSIQYNPRLTTINVLKLKLIH